MTSKYIALPWLIMLTFSPLISFPMVIFNCKNDQFSNTVFPI